MGQRKRRVGIALSLVLVGIVAGALYLQELGSVRNQEEPETPARSSVPDGPSAELKPAESTGSSDSDLHAATPTETDATKRVAVASEDEIEDVPTCVVRVIRSTNQEPFADIKVSVLNSATLTREEMKRSMAESGGMRGLIRAHRTHYQTNAIGEARIAMPRGEGLLCAGNREWFGMQQLETTPGATTTLEVSPDPQVHVFAMTADGVPAAGLPVMLGRDSGTRFRSVLTYMTDANGLATIDGLTALYEQLGDDDLSLRAGIPGTEELEAEVPRDVSSMDQVRWVLPPTASVRLHIVNSEGATVPDAVTSIAVPDGPTAEQPGISNNDAVEFKFVAAEELFRVRVWASGYEPAVFALGPLRAGERHERDVVLRSDSATTRLLLSVDGEPLRDAIVSFRTQIAEGSLRTDEDGRASLSPSKPGTNEFISVRLVYQQRVDQPALSVTFDPSRHATTKDGEHALELTTPPILVAGRALAPGGAPLAGAKVRARSITSENGSDSIGPPRHSVTTFSDGSFRIHGEHVDAMFTVTARHSDFGSVSAEVVSGQTEVELQLPGLGGLRGQLFTKASESPGWVEAIQGGKVTVTVRSALNYRRVEIQPDLSFDVSELNAGLADVSLTVNYRGDFLTIENVPIEHGEVADDPRLQIDLDASLHFYRVEIEDQQGNPVESCQVEVTEHSSGTFSSGHETGVARIITQEPIAKIRVSHPLFLDATVNKPAESGILTLTPRPTLKLQLAGGAPALPDGVQLLIRIENFGLSTTFDQDGVAILRPHGHGQYAYELYLMIPDGKTKSKAHRPDWEAVEFLPETTELDIVHALEPGWLDEELAKLERRVR